MASRSAAAWFPGRRFYWFALFAEAAIQRRALADPVLYQGRETKLRKLKSSDRRSGCMKLVEFLIIHSLSPTYD
jgi:hypothetical protein